MRLAAYIRVSTEEQQDSGLGLEAQRHATTTWASLYGHTIVDTFQDVCSGGVKPEDRPGWIALLACLHLNQADGVIFLRLDRVGRNVSDIASIVDSIRKEQHFISVKEQFDTNSPAGKLMLHVLAAVAQFERDTIRARTVEALAAKKLRGEQVGRTPIIPAAAVQMAEQLYYYNATKLTWAQVAEELAAHGFVNPGNSSPYHPVTVMRAVARLGALQHGDLAVAEKSRLMDQLVAEGQARGDYNNE